MRKIYDAVIALIGLVAIGYGYALSVTVILAFGGLPGMLAGGVAIMGLTKLRNEYLRTIS